MVFVGIDIAKDKHDLFAVDSDGVVLCDNFTFANSAAGFASLLERISAWGKIKVGIEATGHYSSNLLSFLKTHDFEVVVFNPLSVSRLRSAASLRKTKTDKNDSRYIARLLLTGEANPYQSQSYNISVLKSMTRARFRLFQEIQPLKNRFRRLLHVLFHLLGATILSEIGDIKNFGNSDKLLAFAGCEPSTYQSGKYTATNTPMVKHGSRYLRRALYCAADMAYVNSPSFRSYIDRKRAQGKHYYVAMSHGMKKLVRIIFAVLSRNIPFSEPA